MDTTKHTGAATGGQPATDPTRLNELPGAARAEMDLAKFTDMVNAYKARHGFPDSISVRGAMAFMTS